MKKLSIINIHDTIVSFLLSFFIVFLLTSCGGDSSKKGAWSSSDLNKCRSDAKEGMQEEMTSEELTSFVSLYGTTVDDLCDCMCNKLEDMYSSFAECNANIDSDMTEDDAAAMILACMLSSDYDSEEVDSDEEIEESTDAEVVSESSANLSYQCPLCDGVTVYACPDCSGELIWCDLDNDVLSINCPSCEWEGSPMWETCAHCDKDVRSSTKYWTNLSGENHEDCDW